MAEEFVLNLPSNGSRKPTKRNPVINDAEKELGFSLNGDLKEIEDDDDDLDEEDEEENEFNNDMNNPPLPPSVGGGGGIFSSLTGGGGLIESDASVKELFSNDNLLMKTDLSGPAIPIMARLLTLAYKYKAEGMKSFLWSYLKLRVSKDRNGRNDIVALALRRQGMREDDDF